MSEIVLDLRKDPMGWAIADYHKNGVAGRLRVFSSMFDEDEMSVKDLFRTFDEMPALEQRALELCCGNILDVGAGSGCHSLALQEMQKKTCAIDISPRSVEVMQKRGVADARLVNMYDKALSARFDTILMLMNGTGIIGKIENMPGFFARIDELLADNGQLLIDSSDLIYLYENEDGSVDIDLNGSYYGEVDFMMQYKNMKGEAFDWLYVDFETLSFHAEQNGFHAELIFEGEHYDYLARITRK